jgi:hypothetical protein
MEGPRFDRPAVLAEIFFFGPQFECYGGILRQSKTVPYKFFPILRIQSCQIENYDIVLTTRVLFSEAWLQISIRRLDIATEIFL